jgi:hypothetical protein
MLSSLHLPNLDLGPGTLGLILLSAGAALAVCVILIVAALRRAGRTEVTNVIWGGVLVVAGAALAAFLIEHPATNGTDSGSTRRAIERQAAELTARAIAPGSALACLDAVVSPVTDACEKALFVRPEAAAAAIDYVDAKFSLLAAGAALADREPGLRPLIDRLRGALEADRFGLVAHVLTTRGCSKPDCSDLKLLNEPARVLANMTAHTFEARIGVYALAWQEGGITSAAAMPPMTAVNTAPAMPGPAPTTSGSANGARLEFPSAASIPPVSIMTPEPATPAASEPKPVATSTKRPVQPRRQATHEQAPSAQPAPAPSAAVPPPPRRPVAASQQRPAGPPQQPAPAAPAAEPEAAAPDSLPNHGAN